MKKFLLTAFYILLCTFVFLAKIPSVNYSFADTEGQTCDPNASNCDPGQNCVDPYGEGTHFECRTPALAPGSTCNTNETRCPGEQVCIPDTAGSDTGTCKAVTNGAICNPQDPNSCGSYVTSPFTCDPDTSTCQSVSCNPKFGSEDCLRTNYYCVEDPKGSGKGVCMYSTNPPDVTPDPTGAPCANNGYVDVSVPELDKDGKPTGKNLDGKKCASFTTAVGIISTDAFGFIKSGFGVILAASGAVALLLIIRAGYKIMTSQGKPETVQEGRDQLIAAVVGLLFLIFAFVFLEVIGVDILHIPGFNGVASKGVGKKGDQCTIDKNSTQCSGNLNCLNNIGNHLGQPGTCQ